MGAHYGAAGRVGAFQPLRSGFVRPARGSRPMRSASPSAMRCASPTFTAAYDQRAASDADAA